MVNYYISTMIEIIFFIFISHLIIKWLAQDKRCNMVGYFVLYVIALITTEQCALVTMHYFLYWMLPCFGILFILLHQEQLQKNFVAITHAHQKEPVQHTHTNFINSVLHIGLHNSMHQKNTFFIIEGNQDLSLLIQSAVPLDIPLQKEVVESLCDSSLYDQYSAIWLQYSGIIKGINSHLMQSHHKLPLNSFDMLCKKTDCFIVHCNTNGIWTFTTGHHAHELLSTVHIQKLCLQKIASLSEQRSFMYVSNQKTDTQTTIL